jgi:hypothetical protein
VNRRTRCCLVVIAALACAGCDMDRLPQSPNAVSPGAQRTTEVPMGGGETMDRQLDSPGYVAADPL